MEIQEVQDALRVLLNEWDPIGLGDDAPPDEYDCMIAPLLGLLHRGAGKAEIGEFLWFELKDHFGLHPARGEVDLVANRIADWWTATATDSMTTAEPPLQALSWAAEVAGSATVARTVRHLTGGTHAITHLLETTDPPAEMVLQQYPPGDDAAARHAQALAALKGLDGWAPRLLDVDPDGRRSGQPSVLASPLAGRADLMPASPDDVATQLGHVLARIHAVPLTRLDGLQEGSWQEGEGPAVPVLTTHGHRLGEQPVVLTHYDYWAGNVLWQEGRITGVIDWSGASLAPRGFDVSWCRFDMVLMHGPGAAEVFLKAYEEAAQVRVPDVELWDLSTLARSHRTVESWLPNYRDVGRHDLTGVELRRRHTSWTEERLSARSWEQLPL